MIPLQVMPVMMIAGKCLPGMCLASLGFYPVNPVSGKYIIGTPMLEEAVIQLPDGKTFTIKAPRKEHNEIYIRSMRLNGKKYTKNYITHQDIMNGGTLEFVMTASPGK